MYANRNAIQEVQQVHKNKEPDRNLKTSSKA